MKKCPRCKKEAPETEYSKNQYKSNSYCKPCMSAYNKERAIIKNKRKQKGWWV